MKIVNLGYMLGLLVFLIACGEKLPEKTITTSSPEVAITAWTAELVGELTNKDGCVRIQDKEHHYDYALLWTPDISASIEGNRIRIISGIARKKTSEVILQFGDIVRVSGGETTQPDEQLLKNLPSTCEGPYWVVGFEIGTIQAAVTTTPYAFVQESAVVYTTIEEISNNSKIIVVGVPIAKKSIVNTARDPNDPTRQDPEYFGIGQVYEVDISSYIKGNGPKLIYVIQNHGMINQELNGLSDDDIEQAQKMSKVIPLTVNEKYILFLNPASYTYGELPLDQLFVGRGHPWVFRIIELGCVQVEDSITNINEYFPTQTLSEFIGSIQNPDFSQNSDPYTPPESENDCIVGSPVKPYP